MGNNRQQKLKMNLDFGISEKNRNRRNRLNRRA